MFAITASVHAQTATPTSPPATLAPIYYSDVLNRFRFGKAKRPSNAEINAELITEIKSGVVCFVLTDSERKELLKAGASDELIRTIDNALTDPEKRKVANDIKKIDEMNRLYQIVLENLKSNDPRKFQLAHDAAREFVERYSDDERAKDIVTWLKNNVWRP